MLPEALLPFVGLPEGSPLLEEALTHPSFANEQRPDKRVDNQRLEFLGDAVLGLVTSELLMARFPLANEGELSLMRSLLVNTEALAAWARSVALAPALRLGRGADAAGERDRDNVLADAVEALMGAVYVARGIEGARELGGRVVGDPLGRLGESRSVGRDAKSELQEQVQAEGSSSPRYRVIGTEGPDHRRAFHVAVEVDGVLIGEGRGRSKKLAEQAAARCAIEARANPVAVEGAEPPRDAATTDDAATTTDDAATTTDTTAAAPPPSNGPALAAAASLTSDPGAPE